MDIVISIIFFVIVLIIFCVCGFCCKRKREGTVYGRESLLFSFLLILQLFHLVPNVTVTRQHISASPVVVPPYPVEARHPTPQTAPVPAPGPGFATHNPPYPTHTPHPVPGKFCLNYNPRGVLQLSNLS